MQRERRKVTPRAAPRAVRRVANRSHVVLVVSDGSVAVASAPAIVAVHVPMEPVAMAAKVLRRTAARRTASVVAVSDDSRVATSVAAVEAVAPVVPVVLSRTSTTVAVRRAVKVARRMRTARWVPMDSACAVRATSETVAIPALAAN